MSDNFSFTYSLKDRQEIEEIRKKYTTDDKEIKEMSLADKIRVIDRKTETEATVIAIIFGIVATLVFGSGLAIILEGQAYSVGIPIGLLGLTGMGVTPVLFKRTLKYYRNKVSKKMLGLIDEYLDMTK